MKPTLTTLTQTQSELLSSLAIEQNCRPDILLDQALDLLLEIYSDRSLDPDVMLSSLADPSMYRRDEERR